MIKKKVLFVFGTRPELIKLHPVIEAFKKSIKHEVKVCITSQHKELLHDLFEFFSFTYDVDLVVMKPNQTLVSSFLDIMEGLNKYHQEFKSDVIFVQGDTTSAFAGALFGFYNNIKVAHIEAGLRSGSLISPFPEEGNRKMISQVAFYHFCPTEYARINLYKENSTDNVFVVGNTVIDTLVETIKITQEKEAKYKAYFEHLGVNFNNRIILTTMHRRENFGTPLMDICAAIKEFSAYCDDAQFVIPVHPNRNGVMIRQQLSDCKGALLLPPLAYDNLVYLMNNCFVILTDSGGIQEEAISCNKPILILRDTTERQEVLEVGAGLLVHSDKVLIFSYLKRLFEMRKFYRSMTHKINPYGDGNASQKILEIIG